MQAAELASVFYKNTAEFPPKKHRYERNLYWVGGIFARPRFLPRSVQQKRDCFWGSATAEFHISRSKMRLQLF